MAASSPNAATLIPARAFKGVTNPVSSPGTELGLVAAIAARRIARRRVVRAREFGGAIATAITGGVDWVVTMIFRGIDSDALGAVFSTKVTGAVTTKPGLREPGTTRAGADLDSSALATRLFLKPEDPTKHGLLIYRALPLAAEPIEAEGENEIFFGGSTEIFWRAGFLATRDAQGRLVEWLPPQDMTVPGTPP